jgi:crotonobetainyl-CoA:carnitine CoA-transferase CaiB-like acyl-CoA transferase
MSERIFSGLRVVELASVLAGPAVGMFFAELGAEVIKVENATTGGDVTRRWKGPGEEADALFSAYYASINYGKESRMLNLTLDADREEVYGLIRKADIVLTNFRPPAARRFGLSIPDLRTLKPDLLIGALSAFGEDSDRPAFDVVLQAEGGYLFMCGSKDGPPAKMPVALIDLLAAHQLKEGLLCGYIRRLRTGQGCIVQVSLLDAAISSLANQATNWLMGRFNPVRMGTQHPNIAPYGDIFTCKDGKPIVLAAGTEKHFISLCKVLGLNELPTLEEFATNARRVRRREELQRALAPAIGQRKRDDLLSDLQASRVPAGAIRTMEEVFQLPQAQDLVLRYTLPDGSQATSVRTVAFTLD